MQLSSIFCALYLNDVYYYLSRTFLKWTGGISSRDININVVFNIKWNEGPSEVPNGRYVQVILWGAPDVGLRYL